uniref:Uncharacterized protein n=1 Tax=Vespula pensylvanica TaxID=30213 RepID=A0A834PFI3_VESPE|nr:hypothetical protein H0235_000612 [Vespula pensylvanica]
MRKEGIGVGRLMIFSEIKSHLNLTKVFVLAENNLSESSANKHTAIPTLTGQTFYPMLHYESAKCIPTLCTTTEI